jgi:hypothetical protein
MQKSEKFRILAYSVDNCGSQGKTMYKNMFFSKMHKNVSFLPLCPPSLA